MKVSQPSLDKTNLALKFLAGKTNSSLKQCMRAKKKYRFDFSDCSFLSHLLCCRWEFKIENIHGIFTNHYHRLLQCHIE